MDLRVEFDDDVTFSLWLHVQRETGLICCMKPYAKPCTVCEKNREFWRWNLMVVSAAYVELVQLS